MAGGRKVVLVLQSYRVMLLHMSRKGLLVVKITTSKKAMIKLLCMQIVMAKGFMLQSNLMIFGGRAKWEQI